MDEILQKVREHQLWLSDKSQGSRFTVRKKLIQGIDFTSFDMSDAILAHCDLTGCKFGKCLRTNFVFSHGINLNFSKADVTGSTFEEAEELFGALTEEQKRTVDTTVRKVPQVIKTPVGSIISMSVSNPGSKRHLLYHIWPKSGNGTWQWNVEQLLKRIDQFDGVRSIGIVTSNDADSPQIVQKMFDGHRIDNWLILQNDPSKAESVTFKRLLLTVEHEPGITFYGHAKGVKYPDGGTRDWANAMYRLCLDEPEWIDEELKCHVAAGAFLQPEFWSDSTRYGWYFSGTFFWIKNQDIFSLPNWSEIRATYHGSELWIGELISRKQAVDLCGIKPGILYDRAEVAKATAWIDAKPNFVPPLKTFDRVTVINLDRRPDRKKEMESEFAKGWPFVKPKFMTAIDGNKCKAPSSYKEGDYAWACLQSHRRAVEDAVNSGCESLLVLEDDAVLVEGFADKARQFITDLPDDWEFAWFGGHHMKPSNFVKPGIVRSVHMDRCHAYAMRGRGLTELYKFWHQWHSGHCDWAISEWISQFNSYCAQPWLIGQRGGWSDIKYQEKTAEWWPENVIAPRNLTTTEKATSVVSVVGATIMNGFQLLNQDQIESRLSICKTCIEFDGARCKLCTCPATTVRAWGNKLAHPSAECPLKKWGKLNA